MAFIIRKGRTRAHGSVGAAAGPAPVSGDRPIDRPEHDRLERRGMVRMLAAQALAPSRDDGFVLGVMGPWGSGKTSVLRLVARELEGRAIVVQFNPWLFAPGDELVVRFLSQFAAALPVERRFDVVRQEVERYSSILIPVGGIAGTVANVVKELVKDGGAECARVRVWNVLRELDQRVVVFIDDIDRLSSGEVADVVRLVKLVGDFPNTTYLLAYDREQVEHALHEAHGGSGRDYLDKIVQASHPIPLVGPGVLSALLEESLDIGLPGIRLAEPDLRSPEWSQALLNVIAPLLRTVRDVRRLTNVSIAAVELTGDDVALVDVVTLEALRLLLPEFHSRLPAAARALTRHGRHDVPGDREAVQSLVEHSGDAAAATAAIEVLFPAAVRHLDNRSAEPPAAVSLQTRRRVATYGHLMTYLMKAVGEHAVRAATVRNALDAIVDPKEFDAFLRPLSSTQRADLLLHLRGSIFKVPPDRTTEALLAVFNALEPATGELEAAVRPLAEYLFARAQAGAARDTVAIRVSERLGHAHLRLRLLMWFGVGSRLRGHESTGPLSIRATERLRQELLDELLAAPARALVAEGDHLPRLLRFLVQELGDRGRGRIETLIRIDEFLLAWLAAETTGSDTEGRLTIDWAAVTTIVDDGTLRGRLLALERAPLLRGLTEREEAVMRAARAAASRGR